MQNTADARRFVRPKEGVPGGPRKSFPRGDVMADKALALDEGDFLSKLWEILGAPDYVGEHGFEYWIKDTETGVCFSACSGGSGPSYGALEGGGDYQKAAADFEELLDRAERKDCRLQFNSDYGIVTTGAKNGRTFNDVKPADPLSSAIVSVINMFQTLFWMLLRKVG